MNKWMIGTLCLLVFGCKEDKAIVISSSSQIVQNPSSSNQALAQLSTTSESKSKTILDYYLALDPKIFTCEDTEKNSPSVEWKKKQISILDVKNGYIQAKYDSPTGQGPLFEIALFRDKVHNQDVIAVNRSCGDGCVCDDDYFQTLDSKGEWHSYSDYPLDEINAKVAADKEENFATYDLKLPRKGTSIQVVDGNGGEQTLLWLDWADGKFKAREPHE